MQKNETCKECGREIPTWLKINQLVAKGNKIIGLSKEGSIIYYDYAEQINKI